MNRQQAIALLHYLQRASGVIPTTGQEWNFVQGALSSIEAVAHGLVTMDVKPVEPAHTNKPKK